MEWMAKTAARIIKSPQVLIETIVNQYLKNYVTDDIKIAGHNTIQNINFDPCKLYKLFDGYGLPFIINELFIESATLGIKPILEGVEITIIPYDNLSSFQDGENNESESENDYEQENSFPGESSYYKDEPENVIMNVLQKLFDSLDVTIKNICVTMQQNKKESSSGIALYAEIDTLRLFKDVSSPNGDFDEMKSVKRSISISGLKISTDETKIKPEMGESVIEGSENNRRKFLCVNSICPTQVFSMANVLQLDLKIDYEANQFSVITVLSPDISFFVSPRQAFLIAELLSSFISSIGASNSTVETPLPPYDSYEDYYHESVSQVSYGDASSFRPPIASGSGMPSWCDDIGVPVSDEAKNKPVYCLEDEGNSNYSASTKTGVTLASHLSRLSRVSAKSVESTVSKFISHLNDTHSEKRVETVISLQSVVGLILHEDVIVKDGEATYKELQTLSRQFFEAIDSRDKSPLRLDLTTFRRLFQNQVLRNHFQLASYAVKLSLACRTIDNSVSSHTSLKFDGFELVENLCNIPGGRLDKSTLIELVVFNKPNFERVKVPQAKSEISKTDQSLSSEQLNSKGSRNDLEDNEILSISFNVETKYSDDKTNERVTQNVTFNSLDCCVEIDISIINRIDAFFNQNNFFNEDLTDDCMNMSGFSVHIEDTLPRNNVTTITKTSLSMNFSELAMKLRFPVPDFSLVPMSSNWTRNIRNDILTVTLNGPQFQTQFAQPSSKKMHRYLCQASGLSISFQESYDDPVFILVKSDISKKNIKIEINTGYKTPKILSSFDEDAHEIEKLAKPQPFIPNRFVGFAQNLDLDSYIYPAKREKLKDYLAGGFSEVNIYVTAAIGKLSLNIPSKHVYEVLYNRLGYDLILFELHPSHPLRTLKSKPKSKPFVVQEPQFDHTDPLIGASMCESLYYSTIDDAHVEEPIDCEEEFGVSSNSSETFFGLDLNVSQVDLLINTPYRDPNTDEIISNYVGKMFLSGQNLNVQTAIGFEGNENKSYVGVFLKQGILKHDPISKLAYNEHGKEEKVVLRKESRDKLSKLTRDLSNNSEHGDDLLSVVMEFDFDADRNASLMKLAIKLLNAVYDHKMTPHCPLWYSQFLDTFSVQDYPILGYVIPKTISTIYVSAKDSCIKYVANSLNTEICAFLNTLMLSSRMTYDCEEYLLQLLIEQGNVSITKMGTYSDLNPRATIFEVPVFTLSQKTVMINVNRDAPLKEIDMCGNDLKFNFHVDSLREFINVCSHISIAMSATDEGDSSKEGSGRSSRSSGNLNTVVFDNRQMLELALNDIPPCVFSEHELKNKLGDSTSGNSNIRPFSFHDDDNIDKASTAKDGKNSSTSSQDSSDVVIISNNKTKPVPSITVFRTVPWTDNKAERIPKVDFKKKEIPCKRISIHDLSFYINLFPGYALRENYNMAVVSYNTRSSQTSLSSLASSRQRAPYKPYVQIELKGVSAQFDTFPETCSLSRNYAASILDVNIIDLVPNSKLHKILCRHELKNAPTPKNRNFISLKCSYERVSDNSVIEEEAILTISGCNVRMYLDQVAVKFIMNFCESFMNSENLEEELSAKYSANSEAPANDLAPNLEPESCSTVFYKSVSFSPAVDIVVDFEGNFSDLQSVQDILVSMTSTKNLKITLKEINYKRGMSSLENVFTYFSKEWLNDIKINQQWAVGVRLFGPLSDIFDIVTGILQFATMPFRQYMKDGNMFRGFMIGSQELGSHSISATFSLFIKILNIFEGAAGFLMMIVSNKYKRSAISAAPPQNIRDGVGMASETVRETIASIRNDVVSSSVQEHRERGMTGVISAGLRTVPEIATVTPYLAIQATTNILSGVQNQITPGASEDLHNKYK